MRSGSATLQSTQVGSPPLHRRSRLFLWRRSASDSLQVHCEPEIVMSSNRTRNAIVAMGLVVFASAGLAFPFYMASSRSKPVIDSSKPLPPQATFRGPYINTGSRDVGPDYRSYPKK